MLFNFNDSESDLEEGNNNFHLNFNIFLDNDNLFSNGKTELNLYSSNTNMNINNMQLSFQEREQNINNRPSFLLEKEISYINITNKSQNNMKIKKKLGRKKKNSGEKGKHTKYCEDNLVRKAKYLFIRDFIDFINLKIKSISNLYIFIKNKKYKVKKLLYLGPTITNDLTVNNNLSLFEKPIKDTLYEISGKYKYYPKDYNRVAIKELCKNVHCKKIRNILNMNYLDCLKYYRKDAIKKKSFSCLKGLEKKFEGLPLKLEKQGHNKYYEEVLIYIINNFENIYYAKNPKK